MVAARVEFCAGCGLVERDDGLTFLRGGLGPGIESVRL